MDRRRVTYVLYRGDEVLDIGSLEEIAERQGVKPETIRWYGRPAYHRMFEGSGRKMLAVRVVE